jgi:hypothetical protein
MEGIIGRCRMVDENQQPLATVTLAPANRPSWGPWRRIPLLILVSSLWCYLVVSGVLGLHDAVMNSPSNRHDRQVKLDALNAELEAEKKRFGDKFMAVYSPSGPTSKPSAMTDEKKQEIADLVTPLFRIGLKIHDLEADMKKSEEAAGHIGSYVAYLFGGIGFLILVFLLHFRILPRPHWQS